MSDLPKILRQAFADKQVFTPAGAKTPMHSNVSEDECLRLYETVRALRPSVSMEVGFAQGISTLAILQAMKDNGAGLHHVIDPYQHRFENCGLAMVEKAGLGGQFQFHHKFAEEVIPSLPALQFAFIDGSHLFDLTLAEFVLVDKRLDIGGVVGFHDLWMPSLQKLTRYILQNRAYEIYDDDGTPTGEPGFLSRVAKLLPGHKRIFSPEFLKPWASLNLENMVLLRKTADDTRKWDEHHPF